MQCHRADSTNEDGDKSGDGAIVGAPKIQQAREWRLHKCPKGFNSKTVMQDRVCEAGVLADGYNFQIGRAHV